MISRFGFGKNIAPSEAGIPGEKLQYDDKPKRSPEHVQADVFKAIHKIDRDRASEYLLGSDIPEKHQLRMLKHFYPEYGDWN